MFQIFIWLQQRGQSYLENVDLGQTLDDNERLQNLHHQIENESQVISNFKQTKKIESPFFFRQYTIELYVVCVLLIHGFIPV